MGSKSVLTAVVLAGTFISSAVWAQQAAPSPTGLWAVYEQSLKGAKHIDLTHAFAPVQPVWPGFGQAEFKPTTAGADIQGDVKKGEEYT